MEVFLQILIALFFGIAAGSFTGLVPGLHINLVSLLLLSSSAYFLGFTTPFVLVVFIVSMGITHTFLDAIPSIFLGAPDADMAMSVLPGHKMLLDGKGYEAVKLTVIGSLMALIFTILLIPSMVLLVPKIYQFLQPYIGYILVLVVVFMILKEASLNSKFWGFYVFFISGILGVIALSVPNFRQPLFPLLSGMFGISTLIISLNSKTELPKQHLTESARISIKNKLKAIFAAVFSGSLTAIFPALGPAQAAVIAMEFVGNIGTYAFMILIGGVNTVNFLFSLVTLYTIDKARNGAIVAASEIIGKINLIEFSSLILIALAAGGIAAILALNIAKIFSNMINKVNYGMMCTGIILLITTLSFVFSGFLGFLVLLISTAIGLMPPLLGVKRSHAMGCLLMPVIIYFIL